LLKLILTYDSICLSDVFQFALTTRASSILLADCQTADIFYKSIRHSCEHRFFFWCCSTIVK